MLLEWKGICSKYTFEKLPLSIIFCLLLNLSNWSLINRHCMLHSAFTSCYRLNKGPASDTTVDVYRENISNKSPRLCKEKMSPIRAGLYVGYLSYTWLWWELMKTSPCCFWPFPVYCVFTVILSSSFEQWPDVPDGLLGPAMSADLRAEHELSMKHWHGTPALQGCSQGNLQSCTVCSLCLCAIIKW